jgi:hypothetical protein
MTQIYHKWVPLQISYSPRCRNTEIQTQSRYHKSISMKSEVEWPLIARKLVNVDSFSRGLAVLLWVWLFQMYSRDDSAINEENRQIKCESSPPTPRSLRLERAAATHNASLEDTPRYKASLYAATLSYWFVLHTLWKEIVYMLEVPCNPRNVLFYHVFICCYIYPLWIHRWLLVQAGK